MRIWMFIATVLCLQTVEAQRLYSEVGDIYEKSKRTVVDNAKLGAFYKLHRGANGADDFRSLLAVW